MASTTGHEPTIRTHLRPGDIGAITWLHGVTYAEEYGWDHTFEAYVAGPLAEFALAPKPRERIWIVEHDGRVAGSIAIVESSAEHAQLRWFLLQPALRGRGLGRTLIESAIAFSRDAGYRTISLWTVSDLEAAASLYRSAGFVLAEESRDVRWGTTVTEQRYELVLV
jgi:GNAT superfamily N-acetyltransferase